MRFNTLLKVLTLFGLVAHGNAQAQWNLDKSQSELYFTFIKAAQIGTVGHFESFDANVTDDGKAKLTIDLASLNTGIDKRDNRLRNIFFDTSKYPTADVEINLSKDIYERLSMGETEKVRVSAKVKLHGKTKRLRELVNVTLLNEKTVEVATAKPILLDVSDYGLMPGIQKLIDLAGVKSISQSVPVTFRLRFEDTKSNLSES
ncbi:YceI family protein [Endozoicomonas sp.]|uniref:YceI family protein n=1 Tax=Endozoicomonas sp. TaxID=1892382 RepID=UPI003AF4852F